MTLDVAYSYCINLTEEEKLEVLAESNKDKEQQVIDNLKQNYE